MACSSVCRLIVITVFLSSIAFAAIIPEVCPDGQIWEATCDVNPCFGSNNPCATRDDDNVQCIISRCRVPDEDCSYSCAAPDVVSITAMTDVTVVAGGGNATQRVAVPTLVSTGVVRTSPRPTPTKPKAAPPVPNSPPPPPPLGSRSVPVEQDPTTTAPRPSCPAGYYLAKGGKSLAASCKQCPAGTHTSSANTFITCRVCPAGTYAALAGSTACVVCNQGQTSTAGSTRCKPGQTGVRVVIGR